MRQSFLSQTARNFLTGTSPNIRLQSRYGALISSDTLQRSFNSTSNINNSKHRPDPLARRPNKICDPYDQGGKPLTGTQAANLLSTVHSEWTLRGDGYENGAIPTHLTRLFHHPDFIAGASFLSHVAAVAQMNNHFPSMQLERRLDSKRKQWVVESTVTCHTFVLQGLSHHDFFVATVSWCI
jgi:pterin-4a-carbinolamine dehydratase